MASFLTLRFKEWSNHLSTLSTYATSRKRLCPKEALWIRKESKGCLVKEGVSIGVLVARAKDKIQAQSRKLSVVSGCLPTIYKGTNM